MRHTPPPRKFPFTALIAVLTAGGAITITAGLLGGVGPTGELDWLSHLAHEGDSGAQLQLGLAYRDGRYGLAPDPRTGNYWLAAAARGGDSYAADILGNDYATGLGGPQDMQHARRWWQQAASGGNADAQRRLGEDLLVAGRREQALPLLRAAADRGETQARADLAQIYHDGLLADADADLHRGENPLAALGERLDSGGYKTLFSVWRTLEASSPATHSADALLAEARRGDPAAEYQLALRYRDGSWAVARDPQKAQAWLQRAAAAGDRLAAQSLDEGRGNSDSAPTQSDNGQI